MSDTHVAHSHDTKQVHAEGAPVIIERDFKFSFKKQVVMDDKTGTEVKRPPVTLTLPIPTFDGLCKKLTDPKVASLVLDLVEGLIKDAARVQLSDEEKPVMRQEDLDLKKLDLVFIANQPKSERVSVEISKETWDSFTVDYIMHIGPIRSPEKASKHAAVFRAKFGPVSKDKDSIKLLQGCLATWAEKTGQLEEFEEVYTYLDNRASVMLNKDNVVLFDAL